MPIALSAELKDRLLDAAEEGLDFNWLVQISWGAPVGTQYYASRPVTIDGNVYQAKLLNKPQVPKAANLSDVQPGALNDSVEILLLNTPEDEDGEPDGARIQDLMTMAPLAGKLVKVGLCDLQVLSGGEADVKWDGLYQVDAIVKNRHQVRLTCVDATLRNGEKQIGVEISDNDWPAAPGESYGRVRGPVFGKVEDLDLIPVEAGLTVHLAGEIDEQDTTIPVKGELGLWQSTGWVELGLEIIKYQGLDKTAGELLSCVRGAGFPNTTAAGHASGVVVREVYSGRETTLNGSILSTATSLTVASATDMPTTGVLVVESEAIAYSGKSGNTLQNLQRGVPVPTIPSVHDDGTAVRSIPIGPDGNPRYRYVVAEGAANAVVDLRVVDAEAGDGPEERVNVVPYSGGVAVVSQITTTSGKVMTAVDLPARPKVEKYSGEVAVPAEFVTETNGAVDADGIATAASFLRWRKGPTMSTNLAAQLPYALDPNSSAKAAILKTAATDRILDMIFNAHWDAGLNAPRRKYGRFKDARLKVRYQYDRAPAAVADYGSLAVLKDGVTQKTVRLQPTLGSSGANGTISGTQTLAKSRWNAQPQVKRIELISKTTNMVLFDSPNITRMMWADPWRQGPAQAGSPVNHGSAYDGDPRSFICGDWTVSNGAPDGGSPTVVASGYQGAGDLILHNRDPFPPANSRDILQSVKITIHNPTLSDPNKLTGWGGNAYLVNSSNITSVAIPIGIARNATSASFTKVVNTTFANIAYLQINIPPYTLVSGQRAGSVVGDITVEFTILQDVEGQRLDTTVDGSFFTLTGGGSTVATAIYEQTISLGNLAKTWGRAQGKDPWEFFNQAAPQGTLGGLQLIASLPSTAGALQMAIGDVILEMEYEELEVTYDGVLIADVDGRAGTPVGGGATAVLENPVDLLAYLVDEAEFLDMAAYRDAASFEAVRPLVDEWKLARAITEPVAVRDLIAELCGDSRLLQVFDSGVLYCRYRTVDAPMIESVGIVGDQEDVARALISTVYPIENEVVRVANSLGCYYRRNYRVEDFRGLVEAEDPISIEAVGKRRATPNLHWHQSARGYAEGLPAQRAAVKNLADFLLRVSARLWDYVTIELHAAAAESLQRYDVLTLNDPQNGYYEANGRVMSTSRGADGTTWTVRLQMSPATSGYYWQALSETGEPVTGTYIQLSHGSTRMQFYILGLLVLELDATGGMTAPYNVIQSGASSAVLPEDAGVAGTTLPLLFRSNEAGDVIMVYRQIRGGALAGYLELVVWIDQDGNVEICPAYDETSDTWNERDLRTPADLSGSGPSGVVDTGTGGTTGSLQFFVGSKKVAEIGGERLEVREILAARAEDL